MQGRSFKKYPDFCRAFDISDFYGQFLDLVIVGVGMFDYVVCRTGQVEADGFYIRRIVHHGVFGRSTCFYS